MALSFIGKPISLISHSDVRYRGILAGIDPVRSTIQLSNVYSMGTESRRPADQFIGPVQDPYAYIIFRASEVKDLAVDEPSNATPTPNVHDDPAVLGASAPAPRGAYPPGANGAPVPPAPGYPPQEQASPAPVPQQAAPANTQTPTPPPSRRPNNVHTANVSLETVERAMGELRVTGGQQPQQYQQQHHPRGGRGRGGHRGGRAGEGGEQIKVPKTDFDFASSNARFEKAAPPKATPTNEDGSSSGDGAGSPGSDKQREEPAYNPKKSFFDSLSSSAQAAPPAGAREHGSGGHGGSGGGGGNGGYRGRRGGGGPGGMGGRNRREEEREKNVATFGEPGGVGLLGPGGYVGGWGGYGRRGGRPRRGAPGAGRGGSGVGGHAQYAQGGNGNGNGTQQ